MSDIKQNVNKVDYQLKEMFDSVSITETSNNKGFFFTVNATKMVDGKVYTMIAEMAKTELVSNSIKWSYLSNPNDNSSIVERYSSLESIATDMQDVVLNKRFDRNYISSLKEELIPVNESLSTQEDSNNIISNINKIFIYHDVEYFSEIKKVVSYNENVNIFIKTPYKLHIKHKETLKDSTKLIIEASIMKIEFVDYVSFKTDNTIEISVTE